MDKKPSVGPPPSMASTKYIPPSLAKFSATKSTGVSASTTAPSSSIESRLAAAKARIAAKKAETSVPDKLSTNNVPLKEEKKKEFIKLIKDCKSSDAILLELLKSVDYPFDIIDSSLAEPGTPLSYAIRCNKLEVADQIIEKIVAVEIPRTTLELEKALVPLLIAVRNKNIDAITLLANKWFSKIDKENIIRNAYTFMANIFSEALDIKNLEVINALISSKHLLYYKKEFYLENAIKHNYIEAVELIISKGETINAKYDYNKLLLVAVKHNNIPIALLLINKGADVNYKSEKGESPIDIALYDKNTEMAKILIEKGAKMPIISANLRNSLIKTTKNKPISNNFFAFLQPYIAEQSAITIPHTSDVHINKSIARPVSTFGIQEEDGMPILTIPQGSLLYNSFHIGILRDPHTGKVDLNAVLKTLGGLMPFSSSVTETSTGLKINGCIDKFSQKFFYTNPVGGAALITVNPGITNIFNISSTFQTKRELRLAVLMTPGPFHRLEDTNSSRHPALYVCSNSASENCECSPLVDNESASANNKYRIGLGQKCKFGFDYDVCISPEFLHRHNLDGHIAIAGGDSYEDRFKDFQSTFNDRLAVEDKYKVLSDLIFNTCMSLDNRKDKIIRGFPELVIQIFGTDWYSAYSSQRFEHEIPLATSAATATDEEKVRALVGFLLDFNSQTGPAATIPIQTPLQLIRIATEYYWYNFETGTTRDNSPIADLTVRNKYYRYFLASLEAYFNGDLRFIVDPRTGFLVRPGYLPQVLMSDNKTQIAYETLCFGDATGKSELSISANARQKNKSGWDNIFGSKSSENMLEYAPSDFPRNINISGGAQFRTRRKPNVTARKPRRINKVATMSVRKNALLNTRRNRNRNRNTKSTMTLDQIYNIYMDEIKKRLRTKRA